MRTDPFAVKRLSKWHPSRLIFKSLTMKIEWDARRHFDRYSLPEKIVPDLPTAPEIEWANTSVTPVQIQHLIHALAMTEHLTGTVAVEVGSFRGETTRCLAQATERTLVAVDPYIGHGGAEAEYRQFLDRAGRLGNVVHERKTSGEAVRTWTHGPVSFVFIDAVHDYMNTSFDLEAWSVLLVPGGVLALHDTDQEGFAGTRKAAFEALGRFELLAHPSNLTLFIAH
jgi:predicted O-methyltransferase YrrM